MKKILFTLLLIAPLTKSETIELTCDGIYPFYLKYNTHTDEGNIKLLTNLDEILVPLPIKILEKTKIYKLIKTDDYLRFDLRKNRVLYVQSIYVNRKNLKFHYQFSNELHHFGNCIEGKASLPPNQI